MKKLFSILLALTMLTVPVLGEEAYSDEELIVQAKSAIGYINDSYTNFEITSSSEHNGIKLYELYWSSEDNEKSINTTIGSDSILYSLYSYNNLPQDKNTVYTDTQAKETAENFLKRALNEKYNDIEYSYCENSDNRYVFYYDLKYNNISYSNVNIDIYVNKYSNEVTRYDYPIETIGVSPESFEGKKSLTDAETIMKDNMLLGYVTSYDYNTKKYDTKLIYRMKDYLLNAEDLSPLDSDYLFLDKEGNESAAGSAIVTLTPEEIKEIENMQSAISVDTALKTFNNIFDKNVKAEDVNVNYNKKFNSDKYNITIMSKDNSENFNSVIDYKGRLVSYYYYNNTNKNIETKLEKESAEKLAKNLLNKLDCEYELTDLECKEYNNNNYTFIANVIRNRYISFDEYISIGVNNKGEIDFVNANYLNDDIFNKNIEAKVDYEEAYNIAKDKYSFKPYYTIKTIYNDNSTERKCSPTYGFNSKFSINAVTGEILDYYGNKFNKNSVKIYTDLNDQWYAEYAQKLAYMGYSFNSDEFKGDTPLTYKDLKELNKYDYLNLDDYDENKTISRYKFAELLMELINAKDVSKYNEIYIKPFEDVDFKHTGAVAILKAMGVVGGESFRGNDNITRGEAAAMLYRTLIKQ